MSFFGKLFGKASDKDPVSTGEAIQKLRETEEMLMKKQEFLEKKIDQEVATARKNAKTNKRSALQALKRKKRYDKQLQQIDGTLSTIEMQREALEGANTNTAVLNTMNDAAKALKKANADLDVDKVHDMMDDIAEQQDVAKEISEAISSPVAFGQEFDEDELEAELDALGEELELEEQKELMVKVIRQHEEGVKQELELMKARLELAMLHSRYSEIIGQVVESRRSLGSECWEQETVKLHDQVKKGDYKINQMRFMIQKFMISFNKFGLEFEDEALNARYKTLLLRCGQPPEKMRQILIQEESSDMAPAAAGDLQN